MQALAYFIETSKRIIISLYGAMSGRRSFLPDINQLPLIKADSVKFYADTPNTIIRFTSGEGEGYFRECRKHSLPKQFLKELFGDYCQYVFVNENSEECLMILNGFLDDTRGWKLFYKMGEGTARFSRITRFRKTKDYHIIGFREGLPSWFYGQLLQLVQFSWGPIMEHRYCRGLDKGSYQTFNSSKSIVSKLIADYFSVGDLVPRTYYAKLVFDGRQRVGVVVEPAAGIDPELLERKLTVQEVSPVLQKNLLSLWVIDMVCYQKDHRPGNYFIGKCGDSSYSRISAFDNDCPMTLFPSSSISFTTYVGIKPLFDKKEVSRVPFFSRRLYDAFAGINIRELQKRLTGFCSEMEITKLCERAFALKRKLERNVTAKQLTLLSDDEWSTDTMREELRVSSGTYFSFFLRKYVNLKGDSQE